MSVNFKKNGSLIPVSGGSSAGVESKITEAENTGYLKKNLLDDKYDGATIGNLSFTKNSDGSITCSGGTATTACQYYLKNRVRSNFSLPNGKYVFSALGLSSNYNIVLQATRDGAIFSYGTLTSVNSELTVQVLSTDKIQMYVSIGDGKIVEETTIYPMIRKADKDATYVAYAPSNVELNEKINTIINALS